MKVHKIPTLSSRVKSDQEIFQEMDNQSQKKEKYLQKKVEELERRVRELETRVMGDGK